MVTAVAQVQAPSQLVVAETARTLRGAVGLVVQLSGPAEPLGPQPGPVAVHVPMVTQETQITRRQSLPHLAATVPPAAMAAAVAAVAVAAEAVQPPHLLLEPPAPEV